MRKSGIKTQRVRFSNKDLMEALEKAGVPSKKIPLKETPFLRRVHKDVEKFLKEKEKWQKKSKKCNMVFKGSTAVYA